MCVNQRFIYNKYIKQSILVPCGKCEACLQEKANRRKLRLLNHLPNGYDVFFFHLTYSDDYCPYLYMEDLIVNPEEPIFIDIYRQNDTQTYYNRRQKRNITLKLKGESVVKQFMYDSLTQNEFNRLYPITKEKNKVAVLVYEDVQKFFKRLRQRVKRNKHVAPYLEKSPLYYFCTGEYGESHSRCHWHILLYVPRMPYGFKWWQRSVVSCWPYAHKRLTKDNFEYAISPEKYVSQYINCSVDVSRFLLRGKIKPTWHYSHHFGLFNPNFKLGFILENIRKKIFTYSQAFPVKGGGNILIDLPFPTYVTNRFFPKFKGLCRIPFHELPLFIKYREFKYKKALKYGIEYDDCNKIHSTLQRCFKLYHRLTGYNLDDYCIDFINFIKSKFLFQIRQQLECTFERDIIQSYDNVKLIKDCNPVLFGSFFNGRYKDSPFIVDPNKFDKVVNRSNDLLDKYIKYVKVKQLNVVVCQKS